MIKEKIKTKINDTKPFANTVGAGLVSARKTKSAEAHSNLISNLQSLNSKAGITLIALIITTIFSYDEKLKCSNYNGFLLETI